MVNVARFYLFSRAWLRISNAFSEAILAVKMTAITVTTTTALTAALVLAFPAFASNTTSGAALDVPKHVSTSSLKASPAVTKERIMVFGDSLSAAYGINVADGWVALMAARLQPRGVEVVNASISGETSSGGLARIKADLASIKPSIVLLALGANDGLRGLPVAAMQKNLNAIVTACRAAGARVVVIGIQIPPNYGTDYTKNFNAVFPALATQNSAPLVAFLLDGVADKLELFQADRLHPVAAAQPRVLQNVMPAVELALKKSPTKAIKTTHTTDSTHTTHTAPTTHPTPPPPTTK